MNSVIEKLAEVEETAEAIVEHARQQKSEIENRYRKKGINLTGNWKKRHRKTGEDKSKVAAGSRESSGPGTEEGPEGD